MAARWAGSSRAQAAALIALAFVPACASPPDPGEFTRFRYVGQVIGEAPLQVLPPAADRASNVYVLYSDPDTLLETAFIGRSTGTWIPCSNKLPQGTSGPHGWVGHSDERAWYWSGNLLRLLVASTGLAACFNLLEFDPSSAARVAFRAVIPNVRETPSRTTTVALIQSPSDRVPFQVIVDLNSGTYAEAREFSPKSATELAVLGVGADPEEPGWGVVLVRYKQGDSVKVEARFIDADAKTTVSAGVSGLTDLPEFGVAGYLHGSDAGLFAGLTTKGQLIALDRSGGQVKNVSGMTPTGVRRWDGKLWLVGSTKSGPVVAPIDDVGGVGKATSWDASKQAAAALRGSVTIVDDRHLPAHTTTWKSPKTAIGAYPFLGPHAPDEYADNTTLWLIAGPSFDFGGTPKTAIAVSPVGITYP